MNFFKRTVIIKTFLSAIPTTLMFIVFLYVSNIYTDSVHKKNILLNSIFLLKEKLTDLHNKEATLAANLGLYKKVLFMKVKEDESMKNITKTVKILMKKHILTNPKVEISAPKIIKFNNFNLENSVISSIKGTISIDFFSISDINIFSFINAMKQSLPGYVLIQNISLKREGNLDAKTILNYINNNSSSVVVRGHIVFEWYGLSK